MISTGDFLWMARKNGTILKYKDLKSAMEQMNIRPKTRSIAGFGIRGYLVKDDVRRLMGWFEVVLK